MKCDELEEEYLWTNNVKTPSTIMVRAYNADDVDKAIAELKAKLENVQASHYAEMVDAGMRERRLRRALYKACAMWAACKSCLLDCIGCVISAKKWERMYNKCRNKAEEYK